MIGRVSKHSSDHTGLLHDLYRPARACANSTAHLVAGWQHPDELEPPLRQDGSRDFRHLTRLLRQPLALLGDQAPANPVWHCEIRAAPGDPELGDGAWMRIAGEVMHRTGLSRYGEEGQGVRWVAVHHGGNHIHIVATLARQDSRKADLRGDYHRIAEAVRDMEAGYGLWRMARAGSAAARQVRADFPGPVRTWPSAQPDCGGPAAPHRRAASAARAARQDRPGSPR
jgi:hypothetical protein